ncbi:MAG: glycosyltransferase family 2 protein [Ignavibacteria bacterium]|nr:glycosyltransferase family 2 protein [Ignavibacteria bacterium]
MAKRTAIILVMFRQKHNLELLYNSLHRQSYKDFRIYFVDNNPDDTDRLFSEELNRRLGMDIEYIAAGGNTGFAGGNNLGASKAIADGFEYILFLNNDTELEENCLQELINAVEISPDTAVSSPLILYYTADKKEQRIQEYGAKADFSTYSITKYFEGKMLLESEKDMPVNMKVDLVSGAAMLVKADALRKAGLWEEKYFAYGDEIDLAARLKKAGFASIVTKKAVLWHNHKWVKENRQGFYFEYYLIQRNKYLYFRKHKLYFNMFISYITDILKFPVRLLWFIKVCDFKLGYYYLKGTYAGLLGHAGKPNLSFMK